MKFKALLSPKQLVSCGRRTFKANNGILDAGDNKDLIKACEVNPGAWEKISDKEALKTLVPPKPKKGFLGIGKDKEEKED